MSQTQNFTQKHARALIITISVIIIAAIAVIATLLITNNGNTKSNPTTTPHQIITDPAHVTTATPIPTTTPGGTPTIITAPPTTPPTTVIETPKTTTNLKPITNQYTTTQLATATATASLGYNQACTYPKGDTPTKHKTRITQFFTPTSPKLTTYNTTIKTATCTALNTSTNGIYTNGHLNVQTLQHVTGTKTNGSKIDTTYRAEIELSYTTSTKTWHIVNYTQTEEKK